MPSRRALLAAPLALAALPAQAAPVVSWILERRHQDGAWEAVQAHGRYWAEPGARPLGDLRRALEILLRPALPALGGLPDDVSPWTRAELASPLGGVRHGALSPADVARHPALADALAELLASPLAATPIAPRIPGSGGWGGFADLNGLESAHDRLAREARGAGLLPTGSSGAWRLLVALDR